MRSKKCHTEHHSIGRGSRPGAAMVETVVVLVTFLILVFGLLDLGIHVLRSNMVSDAARLGARAAIVHGTEAATGRPRGGLGEWATKEVVETELKEILAPFLAGAGIDSDDVVVVVEFPNEQHSPGSPVRVQVTATYDSFLPSLLGGGLRTVTASSQMVIAN